MTGATENCGVRGVKVSAPSLAAALAEVNLASPSGASQLIFGPSGTSDFEAIPAVGEVEEFNTDAADSGVSTVPTWEVGGGAAQPAANAMSAAVRSAPARLNILRTRTSS